MSAPAQTNSDPDVLGRPIDQVRAWRSGDRVSLSDWVTRLSPLDVEEIAKLAAMLPANPDQWLDHPRDAISTAHSRKCFDKIARELRDGRGFAIIRGLDAADTEALRQNFWVIGTLLGAPVMQNARGEILSEVFDRFAGAPRGIDSRGYESNDELRFHCDGGDCIGLACVRRSPAGGESGLVSLLAIYNELLAHHPEHLETLYRGFPLYVRKETEGDGASTRAAAVSERRIPTFANQNGRISAWLNMVLAEHAAHATGQPMSQAARAALDCLEEIAERSDMKLRFSLEPGDVIWINNLSVMHRRDFYQDDPNPTKRRLFYRMWTNFHEPPDVVTEHAALRRGIQGPKPVVVGPPSH